LLEDAAHRIEPPIGWWERSPRAESGRRVLPLVGSPTIFPNTDYSRQGLRPIAPATVAKFGVCNGRWTVEPAPLPSRTRDPPQRDRIDESSVGRRRRPGSPTNGRSSWPASSRRPSTSSWPGGPRSTNDGLHLGDRPRALPAPLLSRLLPPDRRPIKQAGAVGTTNTENLAARGGRPSPRPPG
jgi:hypothetical protein